jgi:catechol 2,3-dioxygenase-like lactoylglutathione lyase family enzyme
VPFSALDHIGVTVTDLDRSIEFYSLLLGTELMFRETWDGVEYVGRVVGYSGVRLEGAFFPLPGGVMLELLQYHYPEAEVVDMETYNVGNGHLCLVTSNMAHDFERLAGHASFQSTEPVRVPWGPYKGGALAYLRDPDGISIELLELPPDGPAPGHDVGHAYVERVEASGRG